MRRKRWILSLVGVATMAAQPAFSQESATSLSRRCLTCTATAPTSGAAARPVSEHPIVPSGAAELEIALGRLRLVRDRFKIVSNHEAFPDGAGDRSIQVSFHHGEPSLRASYNDPREKWTLQFDATAGAQWTREYKEEGRSIKVVYSQRPFQPIEVEVTGLSSRPLKMSGLSLWHLTKENPLGFTTCVLPSLQRLNASWDLQRMLGSLADLNQNAELSADRIDAATVKQCVADLEASDREVRATALERLKGAGLAAHIPLQQSLQSELGVQQRQAIERLLESLEPRSADTPTRLAYWLSGDPAWR